MGSMMCYCVPSGQYQVLTMAPLGSMGCGWQLVRKCPSGQHRVRVPESRGMWCAGVPWPLQGKVRCVWWPQQDTGWAWTCPGQMFWGPAWHVRPMSRFGVASPEVNLAGVDRRNSIIVSCAGQALGDVPAQEVVAGLQLPSFSQAQDRPVAEQPTTHSPSAGPASNPQKKVESNETTTTPFLLGEGLPPVTAKLVAKIHWGDFVDMAELMRDNMESERRWAEQEGPVGPTYASNRRRREVPDLLSWIQCFGMYASVVTSKTPGKVKQLLAYQTMIVREARRCGGKGWQAYDSMYRQQAANNPSADWSQLNNSLYAVTFLANQNGRGRICQHCLETDHAANDCALAPYRPSRSTPRDPPRGDTLSGRSAPRSERKERICYAWNDGRCTLPYCKYLHICARCRSSEHKAIHCTTYPSSRAPPRGLRKKE